MIIISRVESLWLELKLYQEEFPFAKHIPMFLVQVEDLHGKALHDHEEQNLIIERFQLKDLDLILFSENQKFDTIRFDQIDFEDEIYRQLIFNVDVNRKKNNL